MCYNLSMKQSTYDKILNLLDYIKEFTNKNGYPPTVREIQFNFNIKSTASVSYYLSLLEKENLIKKSPQKNRTVEVLANNRTKIDIPIMGNVAAGVPILASQDMTETFPIPDGFFGRGGSLFMLNVQGNSMINAGINDGDIVVVRSQDTAENGEIAVALIDNEATLKRFFKEDKFIRLHPENPDLSDIIVDKVSILGIAVGLIRRL